MHYLAIIPDALCCIVRNGFQLLFPAFLAATTMSFKFVGRWIEVPNGLRPIVEQTIVVFGSMKSACRTS